MKKKPEVGRVAGICLACLSVMRPELVPGVKIRGRMTGLQVVTEPGPHRGFIEYSGAICPLHLAILRAVLRGKVP